MTWLCDLNDHRSALSFHNESLGGSAGGGQSGASPVSVWLCPVVMSHAEDPTLRGSPVCWILHVGAFYIYSWIWQKYHVWKLVCIDPCYRQILQQLEHWRKRIKQKYPHIWAFVFHDKPTLPSHVPPKAKQRETCLLLRTSRMPTAPKKSRKQSLRVHEMFNNTSEQVARKLMTLWKLIWRSAFYTKLHLYL